METLLIILGSGIAVSLVLGWFWHSVKRPGPTGWDEEDTYGSDTGQRSNPRHDSNGSAGGGGDGGGGD